MFGYRSAAKGLTYLLNLFMVAEKPFLGMLNDVYLFFSQASERARILNPWIWLVNHALMTGPAFYNIAQGWDFSLLYLNSAPKR